jgi:hypothetical protein
MVTMQASRDGIEFAGAGDGELGDERTDRPADEAPATTESLFGPGVPTAEQYADDAAEPEWDGAERTEPIFGSVGQPSDGETRPE